MSDDDDLYELAEPDDQPTAPPPPKGVRPDAEPEARPQPIELDSPDDVPAPAREKRPVIDPADTANTARADEPKSVSPAKARLAREDQRKRAALELAEADARKQKRILIALGTLIGALVLLWLWFKLS